MSSEMESVSDHEVEALARTYGTTVEKVKEVIARTGTRSIRRIQEALEQGAVEKTMATSGEVTVERDGRTYAATYSVEGDMVHVKTHTETRSLALAGEKPEDIARRELEQIVEASRRH